MSSRGSGGRRGGFASSRGRGKKPRGGRGSRRVATIEEVMARNAEPIRKSFSSDNEADNGGDEAAAENSTGAGAGKVASATEVDATSSSDEENSGKTRKFKRLVDFLKHQEQVDGSASNGEEESEDDLAQSMGGMNLGKKPEEPQLTRRQREELDRQRRQRIYEKLHAEGKTAEAKADLARLAEVRERREEAARLRREGGS